MASRRSLGLAVRAALCTVKASGSVCFCKYLNTGRIIFGSYGLSPSLAGCRAGCRVTDGSFHAVVLRVAAIPAARALWGGGHSPPFQDCMVRWRLLGCPFR